MGLRAARPSRLVQSIPITLAAVLAPIFLLFQPASAAETAPAPGGWFTMNKDYAAQRYVDLDQITPDNVAGLKEVCEIDLNEPVVFTSGLIMVHGTLFVATMRP
jgi:glucose dehydrogenase